MATIDYNILDLKHQLTMNEKLIHELELKLEQKEQILFKIKSEYLKQVKEYKTEIEKLKDQLITTSVLIEINSEKGLKESLTVTQEKEKETLKKIHEIMANQEKMCEILEEHDTTLAKCTAQYQKLYDKNEEYEANLATLEKVFYDIIEKYERTKKIIKSLQGNESIWKHNVGVMEYNTELDRKRYEALKVHAVSRMELVNEENRKIKNFYEPRKKNQEVVIRQLSIKAAVLQRLLEVKIRESFELSSLYDKIK